MKMIFSMIISFGLLSAFPALAKKTTSKSDVQNHSEKLELTPPGPLADLAYYPWMTADNFNKQQKLAIERSKVNHSRTISSTDTLPPDYLAFIDHWVKLQTTQDLDQALIALEAAVQKPETSLSLRFVGNQLLPLRSFRAFIYKMVNLAEQAQPRAVHSVLLSFVQQSNQFLKVYLPEHRWQLIFDYITQPDSKDEKQFATVRDLQSYILSGSGEKGAPKSIMTALRDAASGLKKLEAEMNTGRVVWDNRILYGGNTFKDNVERFRILRAVDNHAALAAIHANIAGLNFFCAYTFNNYFNLLGELGQLSGLDGFSVANVASNMIGLDVGKHPDVQGAPAYDRYTVMMKPKFSNTFLLYEDHSFGQNQMSAAYLAIKESVQESALVWEELKGHPSDQEGSFLVDIVNPYSRTAGLTINKMLDIANAEGEGSLVTSPVTGDSVKVNLSAFFSAPPKNLLALLPQSFADKNLFRKTKTFKDGGTISYRNYDRGRPLTWSRGAYGNLFPELKDKQGTGPEVGQYSRVLSQTWGGGLVGLPLAIFVQ